MKMLIDHAVEAATAFMGRPITKDMVRSPRKPREFIEPRFFAASWLRNAGLSYPQVAKAMHRLDHTTIMHACERAREMWGETPDFERHMIRARLIGMGKTGVRMSSMIVTVATEMDIYRIGTANLSAALLEMHREQSMEDAA